jgi:hypothetical protein
MFFVVELKLGVRPWEPVNIIKADNGRAAIDLANVLLAEFNGKIQSGEHRVRRIDDLVCAHTAQVLRRNLTQLWVDEEFDQEFADRYRQFEAAGSPTALFDPRV